MNNTIINWRFTWGVQGSMTTRIKTRARCYWRSNVPIADVFQIEFPNGTIWDLGFFADPRAKENPFPLEGEELDVIVRYDGRVPSGCRGGETGVLLVNLAETPKE